MLTIDNLQATVADKPILKGLSLTVNAGEIHAIMGPNGAGKSTLGYVLGGRPGYEVTGGSVRFSPYRHPSDGRGPAQQTGPSQGDDDSSRGLGPGLRRDDEDMVDLLSLEAHERAAAGLFLGFQYPVEIPGVSFVQFLREAVNAQHRGRGEEPLSGGEFLRLAKEKAALLRMDMDMLKRPVNVGFSGGEKKRAEMVQMGILDPRFAVLDETDSGLDIDALRDVAAGIQEVRADRPQLGILLVTHYQRILDHLVPDVVHVLVDGKIVSTGGPELAELVEAGGFDSFREQVA